MVNRASHAQNPLLAEAMSRPGQRAASIVSAVSSGLRGAAAMSCRSNVPEIDPNAGFRFNLRFLLSVIALVALILAVPVVGMLLISGLIGVLAFFAVLLAVEFPIFLLLGRRIKRIQDRSGRDGDKDA